MKLKTLILGVVLALVSYVGLAQSQAEIEAAKALARQYGYSEAEINAAMAGTGKNASVDQQLQAAGTDKVDRNVAKVAQVDVAPTTQTVAAAPTTTSIFGHSLFTTANLNFIPNMNIPTPANYKLAAGDEIIVDIWGAVYTNYSLTLSPEGSVTIPDVGPVYLNGQTIEQAQKLLKEKLSRIYSGIAKKSPNTFMRLSLGKIRSFTINVVGDVAKPGSYTLPSLSTVATSLYMAGGPSAIGSVRDVRVYRNNKLINTFDAYRFIFDGDFSENIRLEDNDIVRVSTYTSIVTITGNVKRPMRYEMTEGETVSSLIAYAGGYNSTANVSRVHVVRVEGERTQSFDIPSSEFDHFILKDGDNIRVPSNIDENKNGVSISGEVWHPGEYALSENLKTVSQLIKAAGGLKENAFTLRAYINRLDERKQPVALGFSLDSVLNGTQEIMLENSDNITIFSLDVMRDPSMIVVMGEVNKPGRYEFREGMTLADVILLSNGFTNGAMKTNIEVARRNFSITSEPSDTIAHVMKINLETNPELADMKLMDYDLVFVRKYPNFRKQQPITVVGEVNFPGTYVIEYNVVRLSDLVKRAGGLTNDAYVEGATIERKLTDVEYERMKVAMEMAAREKNVDDSAMFQSISPNERYKIGINLKAALKNPGSDLDLVLSNDDILKIPKYNNTVKISGAVMYPNTVTYNPKLGYKDYISMAGGYVKHAMKKRSYVVYMNGMVASRKSPNFHIEPGCEIIVPLKDMDKERKLSPAEIMSIATSTASLATMVVSMVSMFR